MAKPPAIMILQSPVSLLMPHTQLPAPAFGGAEAITISITDLHADQEVGSQHGMAGRSESLPTTMPTCTCLIFSRRAQGAVGNVAAYIAVLPRDHFHYLIGPLHCRCDIFPRAVTPRTRLNGHG